MRTAGELEKLDTYCGINLLVSSEIKNLDLVLEEGEKVIALVQGIYDGNIGLLLATESRLIFWDKGFITKSKAVEFLYDDFRSIRCKSSTMTSTITIYGYHYRSTIDNVPTIYAEKFIGAVRGQKAAITRSKRSKSDTMIQLDELSKLGKLREKGILTEEEFLTQKKIILSKN